MQGQQPPYTVPGESPHPGSRLLTNKSLDSRSPKGTLCTHGSGDLVPAKPVWHSRCAGVFRGGGAGFLGGSMHRC